MERIHDKGDTFFYFIGHPVIVGVNHESIKAVAITANNVMKSGGLSSRNT
jgi:hypothetical protein